TAVDPVEAEAFLVPFALQPFDEAQPGEGGEQRVTERYVVVLPVQEAAVDPPLGVAVEEVPRHAPGAVAACAQELRNGRMRTIQRILPAGRQLFDAPACEHRCVRWQRPRRGR